MGNKIKYNKGDKVSNAFGKPYGTIVQTENSMEQSNRTNRYSIELLDGSIVSVLEHNIIESEHHKDKEN